jgi:hypothetical protein
MYLKIDSLFDETPYETNVQLRNKSWKPECVGKKRFNGRVLPTGFGKSMCYVPPF